VQNFREKGCVVNVRLESEQRPGLFQRKLDLAASDVPLFVHFVEGQVVEDMLGCDLGLWRDYI
jgi:hypothetical protein